MSTTGYSRWDAARATSSYGEKLVRVRVSTMHLYIRRLDSVAPLLIVFYHLCILVSFEPLYEPQLSAQAPSQLWPKVEEARVRGPCARNAPSSWQVCRAPASSLSVGVCSAISICAAWGGQT